MRIRLPYTIVGVLVLLLSASVALPQGTMWFVEVEVSRLSGFARRSARAAYTLKGPAGRPGMRSNGCPVISHPSLRPVNPWFILPGGWKPDVTRIDPGPGLLQGRRF